MSNRFVTNSAVIEFGDDDPLGQARRREEVLLAQLYALNNVSALFEIVCKATSPAQAKKAISEAWRMTDRQAQVIIEMQVDRFIQGQQLRIRDELADLQEFIAARNASQDCPRSWRRVS